MSKAQFAELFEAAWNSGDADPLVGLLDRSIRLRQPFLPPIDGRAAAHRSFTELLSIAPGIHADVSGWVPTDDGLFIEFELVLPGDPERRWGLVDRFVLAGDLATLRISYWQIGRVLRALASRPEIALKLAGAGARPRGAKLTGRRAADIPGVCSGARDGLEIAEFVTPLWPHGPEVRGAVSTDRSRSRPDHTYLGAPIAPLGSR